MHPPGRPPTHPRAHVCVQSPVAQQADTADLRTEILDFRGLGSSRLLNQRGGIPSPIGNLPERLGQRILVWRFSEWRLTVQYRVEPQPL